MVHLPDVREMVAFGIEDHHFWKFLCGLAIDGPERLVVGRVLVVFEELLGLSVLGDTCRE